MHNLVSALNATVLYTLKWVVLGNFLVVQLLGLHLSITGATGSVPGKGTKILHAAWPGQKKKEQGYFTLHEFRSINQSCGFEELPRCCPGSPRVLSLTPNAWQRRSWERKVEGTVLGPITAHWGLVLTLLWSHLLPGPGGWTRSTSTTPGDPNTAQLAQRVTGTRPSSYDIGSKLPPPQPCF